MIGRRGARRSGVALLVFVAAALRAPLAAQGDAPARIVVQVRSTAGAPVARAQVALVVAVGQPPQSAVTDSAGSVRFERPGGTGEYVLTVRAEGFRSARRRVVHEGGALLRVAFVLADDAVTALETVRVRANRDSVERRFIYEAPPGHIEAPAQGSNAVAPPTVASFEGQLRNNLLFDGLAGAGSPAGESQVQLNGLLFPGTALPRSAPVVVRGVIAEYDVSAAGYSGGRIAADLGPAGEYQSRTATLAIDATARDAAGAAGAPIGVVAPSVTLDVGGTTLLARERRGLAWGARLDAATRPNLTVERVPADWLAERGLDAASAAEVRALAQSRGLAPATPIAASSRTIAGSAIARLDFERRRDRANALVTALTVDDRRPGLFDPFGTSRLATGAQDAQLTLQHLWERTDRHLAVWRARTGVVGGRTQAQVGAGDATSLVTLLPVDDARGAPALRLGGPLPATRRDRLVVEQQLEREQRVGLTSAHQVKLFVQWRGHRLAEEVEGTQGVVDVAGVEALRDARGGLARTLRVQDATAWAWRASAGVNDVWRLSNRLRATGGVRADWQRLDIGGAPGPQQFDLSPRLGVTWSLVQPKEGPGFVTTNLLSRTTGPSGVLRLGTGLFTGDFAPDDAVRPGGSSAFEEAVACRLGSGPTGVGAADAESFAPARLDAACRATAGVQPLAGRARVGDAFAPPRTWRTSAGFVTQLLGFDVTLDAVVSRTVRQPRLVDLAVPRTPVVPAVGGRPFFAAPDSIDPATGALRPGRMVDGTATSRDLVLTSEHETAAERVVLGVGTRNGRSRWPFRVGYAWGRVTTTRGGWEGDVDGSPWRVERRASPWERRHQLQLDVAHAFGRVDASFWMRTSSGTPYAPLVAGDVNGDGSAGNDRVRRTELASLVTGADPATLPGGRAGRCLARVTDAPGAATCRTPWSVTSALSLKLDVGRREHFPRANVQLAVENPVALLGGSLRRASGIAIVDPVAAQVRGYDPVAQRHLLAVDPAFGTRLPLGGTAAGLPRLTLFVSIPLAPTIREQQVDRWFIRRGLGAPLTVDSLAVLFARGVPNLIASSLDREDELGLTPLQRARLVALRDSLDADLQRTWRQFAAAIQRDAPSLSREQLMGRMQEATDAAWERSRLAANALGGLLTPLQQSLLPTTTVRLMRATGPVRIPVIYY